MMPPKNGSRSSTTRRAIVAMALVGMAVPTLDAQVPAGAAPKIKGVSGANFAVAGEGYVRLAYAAFDPVVSGEPPIAPHLRAKAIPGKSAWWLVQLKYPIRKPARDAVLSLASRSNGYIPEGTFILEMTPQMAARARLLRGVRWVGLYHPAYKLRPAYAGSQGVLDLRGKQGFRAFLNRQEKLEPALEALSRIDGVSVDATRATSRVVPFTATARELPAVAALGAVRWVSETPDLRLLNFNARWASDTGERDTFRATAPGGLTGAGQAAGVADTGLNYVTDIGGHAQRAFADFNSDGSTKVASYTQDIPGDSQEALFGRVATGSNHRKVAAYYDLGGDGYEPSEASNHGTHTAGSIAADYPTAGGVYGTYASRFEGADGMAPGAHLVIQDVSSGPSGSLGGLPADHYDLFEQVYDAAPGTTTGDTHLNGSAFHLHSTHTYNPTVDARTHNYSIGSAVPLVDLGDADAADGFVYDHEDFVASASAGNSGPDIHSVSGGPQVSKNLLTSCASANGRQPLVTLDSAASFSSHGPTAEDRLKPDVCTPGQIVVSPKGATNDTDHYLQGTSMSSPILTGLATLVREYFYEGFGPAPSGGAFSGYAAGSRNVARRWNPSAALVRGILINSAERMRGRYTGDAGDQDALDGQWPSGGQGWGRVELDNALVFGSEARKLFVADVWNASSQALDTSSVEYTIPVTAGEPLEATVTWTDVPSGLGAGTAPLVNNLDLTVTAPDGTTVYTGNNFTTQSGLVFNTPAGDPTADIGESRTGAGAPDVKNNVEAVRIEAPVTGTYTIRIDGGEDLTNLIGTPGGKQGYALVVSGLVGAGAAPASKPNESNKPVISDIEVDSVSADLALVSWKTNEPTTGAVLISDQAGDLRFEDVHNPTTFQGMTTPQNENKGDYADRKVVGRDHVARVTGLSPGKTVTFRIEATDLAQTPNTSITPPDQFISTDAMYQPIATDMAQLLSGDGTTGAPLTGAQQSWGASTQLYVGVAGNTLSDPLIGDPTPVPRNTFMPSFMFRLPSGFDPKRITGASVELTSAHDITNHYTDDVRYKLSLLDSSVESDWGPGKTYESVEGAEADAVSIPETGYRRGGGTKYAFNLSCSDMAALRQNLSEDPSERKAAFRLQSDTTAPESVFSFEFGLGRRSRGPENRPRLILQIDGQDAQPCEATSAPKIADVQVQSERGSDPGSVVVSWKTDVPSSSIVLFRKKGTASWSQVGSPIRTTNHMVTVGPVDAFGEYQFAVRSRTCKGLETTDDNGDRGYALFPEASAAPKIDRVWVSVDADRSAVVRWVTDVDATSAVEYGTSPSALTQTATPEGDAANESRRAHEVKIPPLQPCTTYHFRAVSVNRAGKRGAHQILTFNTASDQLIDLAPVETFDTDLGAWTVKTASEGLPPTEWAANGATAKTTIGGTSPGYGSNVETRLVSPVFTAHGRPLELSFTETFHSEADFDYGVVEYSLDDGRSWKSVRAISGVVATDPTEVKVPINGVPAGTVRIGFRMSSDGNTEVPPGWSVDDVILREVAACSGLGVPTAPTDPPPASGTFKPRPVTGPAPAPAASSGSNVDLVRTHVDPESALSPSKFNAICVEVLGAGLRQPETGVGIALVPAMVAFLAAFWVRRRLIDP